MTSLDDLIDPKLITIRRDKRQRRMIPLDADFKKSISKRIISPIIVNDIDGELVLVAGERRLTAALELGLALVPIRRFQDLSPEDAQITEMEENLKRLDLPWRDFVRAIGQIHTIFLQRDPQWSLAQTASEVHFSYEYVRMILQVYQSLDSEKIAQATGVENAHNILLRLADRMAEGIVSNILNQGTAIFQASPPPSPSPTPSPGPASGPIPPPSPPPPPPPPPPAITQADFIPWADAYTGPKFNFIHVDFPYGTYKGDDSSGTYTVTEFYDNTPEVYLNLLHALCRNLDRLISHSAHLMFWFDMKFYTETFQKLTASGLVVHPHPLIWHKTIGGVMPGNSVSHPRRTYDTALLCVKGNRPFVKPGASSYAAPPVHSKVHPSQKPEPMLRFFFSMFVDVHTTMLDPTCGSGSALKAAEDLGAKSVLGLELDPEYVAQANAAMVTARILRIAGR
jgi:hypothetical protein